MSNTTIFVALQCCQCSMMQVKQKKKSSNKWTCVICNQKQSVKKVFAEGYMARDLRQFVQSFNMNRGQEEMMPNKKAKLSTGGEEEYEEYGEFCSLNDDSGVEVKNNSKWRDYLTQEDEEEIGTSQLRMTKSPDHKIQGVKKKQNNGAATSKWSALLTDEEQKPTGNDRKQKNVATSKWSEYYLTNEEQKTQVAEKKKFFAMEEDKSLARDIQVEDDIHPDFL